MFEILMLCGFLLAATTSLLPVKSQGSRQRQPRKNTAADKEIEMKQPHKRHHPQIKGKTRRSSCKAYAA